jgi:hypothetical protein
MLIWDVALLKKETIIFEEHIVCIEEKFNLC